MTIFLSYKLAYDLYNELKNLENSNIYKSILELFNSYDIISIIKNKFNLQLTFNTNNFIISSPGSYISYDNYSNNRTIVRCILYMNKNYFRDNGGELHLLSNKSMTVEKIFNPIFNRLIILLIDKNSYYGVSINKKGYHGKSLEFDYIEKAI